MIQIQYWDDSDICGFVYSTGYKNNLNIQADFRVREFEYEDEGVENGDSEFVPIFQKLVKQYVSSPFMCMPSQREALEQIALHKYIKVILPDGTNQFVKNFEIENAEEIEDNEYLNVQIKFQVDYQINRSRKITLADVIDTGKKADVYKFADASSYNSISSGTRIIDTVTNNIYYWDNGWINAQEKVEGNFVYVIDEDYEFYYNGSEWVESPKITAVTNVSGDNYKVKGTTRNGFIRIEATEDGGLTWTNLAEILSAQFRLGYTLELLPIYDNVRVTVYRHGGIETTSTMYANPNVGDYLTVTESLTTFTSEYKQESGSQFISVEEGVDATTDTVLTAPTGFEISENDNDWHDEITLTSGYTDATIFIRATAENYGNISGNLSIAVNTKTYNVALAATISGTIDWVYDWIDDLNGEAVSTLLTEKLDYATATKENIRTEINAKGGSLTTSDTFRSYGAAIAGLGGSPGWTPPDDVATVVDNAFALISSGENKVIGLYLAYPDIENYIAFRAYFSGTGTIDWGDGSAASSVTSGTTKEAILDYDNIPGSIITSLGAKLAVVEFEATGDITDVRFTDVHSTVSHVRNWFAAKCCTNASVFTRIFANIERMMILEIDKQVTTGAKLPSSCKKLIWKGMNVTSPNNWASSMFRFYNQIDAVFFSTDNLVSLPWTQAAGMSYCFNDAHSALPLIFEVDIDNCTTLLNAWNGSYAFSVIKLGNTGNVTTVQNAIYGSGTECYEMDDCSGVTTTTNFVRTITQYNTLKRLILTGLTVGIDISYSPMTATALDAFFTSLGTANGAQTITVIGCIGALTCDTSIATAKGYTVITT